jgi:hypothetical protein
MEGKVDSRKSVCADYENEKNLEEKFLDSRIMLFTDHFHGE